MSLKNVYDLLKSAEKELLKDWMHEQMTAISLRLDLIDEKELQQQSNEFLKLFTDAISTIDQLDIQTPVFASIRHFLSELSSKRAAQGFSPSETATFIFSLKQPLFNYLSKRNSEQAALFEQIWSLTILLDKLGLFTIEQQLKAREEIIARQQQEMMELSTPVVKLWEGILILPLIGTLDSARTQQVMENLLQKIVETNSTVAIIDITGIPTVDTLVAQHLIKTINAARLMGAECIVSGIRPQIAQTIVHLGISLHEVITRATLSDAIGFALQKTGFNINRLK